MWSTLERRAASSSRRRPVGAHWIHCGTEGAAASVRGVLAPSAHCSTEGPPLLSVVSCSAARAVHLLARRPAPHLRLRQGPMPHVHGTRAGPPEPFRARWLPPRREQRRSFDALRSTPSPRDLELSFGFVMHPTLVWTTSEGERQARRNQGPQRTLSGVCFVPPCRAAAADGPRGCVRQSRGCAERGVACRGSAVASGGLRCGV